MVAEIFVPQLVRSGAPTCTLCGGKVMNGLNCTCATETMWLFRATQGKVHTTACYVRDLTNDCDGGTNLRQMEIVSAHFGVTTGKVYQPIDFDTVSMLVATGRYGAHLNISYRAFVGTPYDREGGRFSGNHDIYLSNRGLVNGTLRTGDPLATGYADIPKSLLKSAAGLLDLGGGTTLNSVAGFGKCYAYVTPGDPNLWGPDVPGAIEAVDPAGTRVAAAVRKAGQNYGFSVGMADLAAAMRKVHHNYGSVLDASDVRWLLNWAATH